MRKLNRGLQRLILALIEEAWWHNERRCPGLGGNRETHAQVCPSSELQASHTWSAGHMGVRAEGHCGPPNANGLGFQTSALSK